MSKKISPRTLNVIDYFKNHPDVPVAKVAGKFNIALSQAYQLRKRAENEKLSETIQETLKEFEEEVQQSSDTNVDAVLDSRAQDYGKFIDGAEIMQMLKRLVHNYIEDRNTPLAFDQREAIDMIIHKLGRIINGNPDKVDSWVDIAGYATLVADRLEGNAR